MEHGAKIWIAKELGDEQAVLIADESGSVTPSTDFVGTARQHSGALNGAGLCQAAVHLAYAAAHGRALIDRELYLTAGWAEDEERGLLRHVRDDATNPQMAAEVHGIEGGRRYDWALVEVTLDGTSGCDEGQPFLIADRHRYTSQMSFCRGHSTTPFSLADSWASSVLGGQSTRDSMKPGTSPPSISNWA
ncbi:transposase [Streptomyces sp. NPDC005549]|uniref:transposase n=1 Tax=Streptomyces sp. NPDC005549 TaxID=3154888 RepID=UPI0033A65F74